MPPLHSLDLRNIMKANLRLHTLAQALLGIGLASSAAGSAANDQHETNERRATATWCAERCDDVVTDWSLAAFQIIKAGDGYGDPMAASRSLAMMHLAMHDAANTARPRFQRYALANSATTIKADAAVAAATAAHDVMAALYPQAPAVALAKTELDKTMLQAGTGADIAAGAQLGKAAAAAVLAKRANDGSNGNEPYVEGTQPGQYRFTAPFNFAAAPYWRHVTPFALTSASQFRTAAAPALTSEQYRRDFDEVKRVGGKASTQRSTDETHYAAFWYEFSDIGWNRIARAASGRIKQDLWQRARTFALLNAAMADAYIAGWDSKFTHNVWRPVTAIQLAGQDGNAATAPDASFDPLLTTPPVPDMPSTHSALGMAAATVLAQAFGRDQVAFSFASSSARPANPVRRFRSFSEAARENADSRVKAGLHFRFATQAGLELGRQIGQYTARHLLQPHQGSEVNDD
jgi:PAP2 superfamily